MPSKAPSINSTSIEMLNGIAQCIRTRRKSLCISTVVAAHASGVSRVTWHRIENAEASVTMGAYVGALEALGLNIELKQTATPIPKISAGVLLENEFDAEGVPATISIQKYRQLRQIAWHVKDDFELTPEEAFGLYDRYRRHLNFDQMEPHELRLLRALEKASVKEHHAV